MDFGHMLSCA